jgi:hypothetical protein
MESLYQFRRFQLLKYIPVTTTILGIIHRRVFYLERDISGTGFRPRFQVERVII